MMVVPVPSAAANTAIMRGSDPHASCSTNSPNMRANTDAAGAHAGSGADAADIHPCANVLGHSRSR